jgi:hypothetical protein
MIGVLRNGVERITAQSIKEILYCYRYIDVVHTDPYRSNIMPTARGNGEDYIMRS